VITLTVIAFSQPKSIINLLETFWQPYSIAEWSRYGYAHNVIMRSFPNSYSFYITQLFFNSTCARVDPGVVFAMPVGFTHSKLLIRNFLTAKLLLFWRTTFLRWEFGLEGTLDAGLEGLDANGDIEKGLLNPDGSEVVGVEGRLEWRLGKFEFCGVTGCLNTKVFSCLSEDMLLIRDL